MLVWAAGLPAADLLIGPVPPLLLTAVRMALAAICLLPVWWIMEGGATIRNAGWLKGIAIGGGTIGFGAFLLAAGQGMTNAVTAVVIAASMPVVGIAIEVVLDGRKITASLLVGLVLSFAGGLISFFLVYLIYKIKILNKFASEEKDKTIQQIYREYYPKI